MTTRLVLAYKDTNSHAFTVATPWIRLLIEVESTNTRGHVIGKQLALHKTPNADGVIERIQVELYGSDAAAWEKYIDACAWWLQRGPLRTAHLLVVQVAHQFRGALVSSPTSWRVCAVDLAWQTRDEPPAIDCAVLVPLLADLEEVILGVTAGFWGLHRSLQNVEVLQSCPRLRDVDVSKCDVPDLRWLPVRTLASLTAAFCRRVTSMEVLLQAPQLRAVCFAWTPVRDLSLLRQCPLLEQVDLTHCSFLNDIAFCSELMNLEKLSVSETDITDLTPLAALRRVAYVNVSGCRGIHDLSPLAHLPRLQEVLAARSGVSLLGPLHRCVTLRRVDLSRCSNVHIVVDLAGACALAELNLSASGLASLEGVSSCPTVRTLSASQCGRLRDVSPLQGMQSLAVLDLSLTIVSDVTPLVRCCALTDLCLNGCLKVSDLSPLGASRSLVNLDAEDSGATTLEGLFKCTMLRTLRLRGCWQLCDISPLAGAPSLCCVDASQTRVEKVPDLSTCPALKMLMLRDTPAAAVRSVTLTAATPYQVVF